MKSFRRLIGKAAIACAAPFAAGVSSAQSYPDKPLRIVVGAPAGGTSDILARVLAEGLGQQFGQPVVVDNKPGGLGIIGLQELLKAPHDGYTMMVGPNGIASEIPHVVKMPVDPLKELRPLVELARTGLLMVGAPQLPANSFKEAVAYIKANPGKVSFASYSAGTMSHTMGLTLNKLAGLDMTHVGYKGSPPALADVMAGHVPFMFDGPATSVPAIKGGKVKVFATSAPSRLAVLPDVPTFAELGFRDMTEVLWMGLFVTPDVPAAAQARLRDAVLKVLQQPAVRERFAGLGLEIGPPVTPDELTRAMRAAHERQGAQLRAIGFKPE